MDTIVSNGFAGLLLAVALLILIFAALNSQMYFVQKAQIADGTHPAIADMIHRAMVMAYKASDQVFDDIGARLHGMDKKAIAEYVYDTLLPDEIQLNLPILSTTINWKNYISKDQFTTLIEEELESLTIGFQVIQERVLEEMEKDLQAS